VASKFKGLNAHRKRLKALASPAMTREIGKALFAAGDIIRSDAILSITRGSVSGKGHVPSKPGDPPMNDTGVLAGFINVEQRIGEPVVHVRSDAPYASPLEFGSSKMAARPYLRPARDRKRKEVKRLVEDAINRTVKSSRSSD